MRAFAIVVAIVVAGLAVSWFGEVVDTFFPFGFGGGLTLI